MLWIQPYRRAKETHVQRGGVIAPVLGALVSTSIIGALIYVSMFVEPSIEEFLADAPPIESRDVFYGVAPLGPNAMLVVGQHGKVVRSDDAGMSWKKQLSGTDAHLQSIAAWDEDRAVAVGNGMTIVVTADGGRTWRPATVPAPDIDGGIARAEVKLLKVRSYGAETAWAVGEFGVVLRSTDAGASWQSIDVGEKDAWASWNDIVFVGPRGWLVGEFARIRRSEDGGETWEELDAPIGSSLNAVDFRDSLHGVAVGTSGVGLSTRDGGRSWVKLPEMNREHLFDVSWDGSLWVAVGDNGVLFTAPADADRWDEFLHENSGKSWHTAVGRIENYYVLVGARINLIESRMLQLAERSGL